MSDSSRQFFSRRQWLGLASASAGASLLPAAAEPPAAPPGNDRRRVYDIRDFGAVGDGKTLNTAAVQAAVDTCFKDGGGLVLVPAGVFQIGTIELKSNVTLHIAAGGTLLGSGDGRQYHPVDAVPLEGDATAEDGHVALLYAVHAENVTVEGPGTIDGQGALFRHRRGDPNPPPAGISGTHRPYHLMFYRCRHLRVRNLFLKDGAYHALRIFQCDFCWFDGLHIHSRVNSNNDGFHFISCRNVHLANCDVQCQDDACALFGSCQFVTVTNCSFSTRWSVFRFGGGAAENIAVSNCILDTVLGCPIKIAASGRSRFQNMLFTNLVMNRVTGPISISMGSGHEGRRSETGVVETTAVTGAAAELPAETAADRPIVRNLVFSGICATVVKPFPLPDSAWPSSYHPGEMFSCIALNATDGNVMENIILDNIHVTFPGGGTAEQAAVRDVPQVVGEYYAAGVFPSYALYARQVRGLTLNNVRFDLAAPDLRPAVVLDHVQDAAMTALNVQGVQAAESALRFINSKDVLLSAPRLLAPTSVFLQIEGADNQNIIVDGGDLTKATKPLACKNGAKKAAVTLRL